MIMVPGSRMAAVIRKGPVVADPEVREVREVRGHTADREAITVALMAGLSHTAQALAAPAEETPLPGGDTALNPVSVFRMISAVHDTG